MMIPLSFPSNPETKAIVYTCFEVRFVSANEQDLFRIVSKTTGNKRLNNVLQLYPNDFYTSPAGDIVQDYISLSL